MIGDPKEVYFADYCHKCEYIHKNEDEEPCDECLNSPFNTDSHKPTYFKEATNEKPNRSIKKQSVSK